MYGYQQDIYCFDLPNKEDMILFDLIWLGKY